jgi:hypothetical protein
LESVLCPTSFMRDCVLLTRAGDINIHKVGICMFMRRFAKFQSVQTGPRAESGTRQGGHLVAWNLNELRDSLFPSDVP